jgi:hypothetical protein
MRCAHFSRHRGKSAGASSTVFTDHAVLTGQNHCRSRSVSAQAKLGVSCGVEVPTGEDLTNHPYQVVYMWKEQSPEQAYAAASR